MQILEINDKNKLNDFLGAQEHSEFLQSWEWGEFQEKVERPALSSAEGKIIRLGVEENGELIAVATLVKKSLPFGMSYFYCPRGPIVIYDLRFPIDDLYNLIFAEVKKIVQKENAIFLRFEPGNQFQIPNSPSTGSGQANMKYQIRKSIDIQVSKTIILDLNLSEEELLAKMHQKTRYNIRLAEKKGVKIREAGMVAPLLSKEGSGGGSDEFDKFWSLMSATVNRDGFRLHEKGYYEQMLSLGDGHIKLFFGEFEGKIICAGIFSFFGDTAVYLHGASANENRELMAPHLLQWEMIKKAKSSGCKFYDFSGIDEQKWPGVTRFKRGFLPTGQAGGGHEMNYPGTFDVIFAKHKYLAYQIFRKIRRLIK